MLSSEVTFRAGVPQGAIISPILFNIMVSDLPKQQHIEIISYADDITLVTTATNINTAKKNMQAYLNNLVKYFNTWGMQLNPGKTKMQVFHKRRTKIDCSLRIEGIILPSRATKRLLGIEIDAPKLNYGKHVQGLVLQIRKRIDIMKYLSSTYWGASQKVLKNFYTAFIRSKMEYGCIIYRNASQANLKKLDILQNRALRLMLGARNTSPITSMEVLANIPPLNLFREFKRVSFYIKLLYKPFNDKTATMLGITSSQYEDQVVLNSFSFGIRELMEEFGIEKWKRSCTPTLPFAQPWVDMSKFINEDMPEGSQYLSHLSLFNEMVDKNYKHHIKIYTDGSKIKNDISSASSAIYVQNINKVINWKLDGNHSILAAELFAIYKALLYIKNSPLPAFNKFVILSDSKTALTIVASPSGSYSHLVSNIQLLLIQLNLEIGKVTLQWIKAHSGILGNEIADQAAKLAHNHSHTTDLAWSMEDMLGMVKRGMEKRWNEKWKMKVQETNIGTHTLKIYKNLNNIPRLLINDKRLSVVINRLQVGHAGVNSYLHRFNME